MTRDEIQSTVPALPAGSPPGTEQAALVAQSAPGRTATSWPTR